MSSKRPDGISYEATKVRLGYANPLPLILLTIFMIAGLTGFMGGNKSPELKVENSNVVFALHGPTIIRNGMAFETRFTVQAKRPIRQLAISVPNALWRDMTINSMIPAASDENANDGSYHFIFSELPAGQMFQLKVDGQINPPLIGHVQGPITLWDGPTKLAVINYRTKVLP